MAEYIEKETLDSELYNRFHDEDEPSNITDVRLGSVRNFVRDFPTADVIPIPEGATNGDMVDKIFGKDVYWALIRMMYSSCCEKLDKWWDAPYTLKRED